MAIRKNRNAVYLDSIARPNTTPSIAACLIETESPKPNFISKYNATDIAAAEKTSLLIVGLKYRTIGIKATMHNPTTCIDFLPFKQIRSINQLHNRQTRVLNIPRTCIAFRDPGSACFPPISVYTIAEIK